MLKQTKGSVGIGVYIPSNVHWSRTNWRNRDGTVYNYEHFRKTSKGIPYDEPNSLDLYGSEIEKIAIAFQPGWADFASWRIERLLCKLPATPVAITTTTKKTTPKPTTKPTPKPTPKPTTKTTTTTKKTTPKPTTPKPTTKKPTTTTKKTTTPKPTTRKAPPKPTIITTTTRKATTTTAKIPQSCYV